VGVEIGRTGVNLGVAVGERIGRGVETTVGFGVGVAGSGVSAITTVGIGFGVETGMVGLGVGVAVGVGDSSVVAGDFCWNGVDAASCARTKEEAERNRIARASERMVFFRLFP